MMLRETLVIDSKSSTDGRFLLSQNGSIMVVIAGAPRESLNLRVPPELKQKIEAYAQAAGVSINAAACLLLAEALRIEGRKR